MYGRNAFTGRSQRGAAALIVVVVLFFILALVTAYAGRNLIFEQRTSINNQRATQAFEIAEAGVEAAIALLGGGRVDAACQPTTTTTEASFRQRHLTVDPTSGMYMLIGGQGALRPSCMLLPGTTLLPGSTSCSCPAAGAPTFIEPVGLAPTFQLQFQPVNQPGLIRLISRGCSSIGTQCYAASAKGASDAVAEVSLLLGLNSALAAPPLAAITARGTVDLNGEAVTVSNPDLPTQGITIHAGWEVEEPTNARIYSVPGTPGGESIRKRDPKLFELDADGMFRRVFGMDRAAYRTQPAVVPVTCSGSCDAAIAAAVSANPGRIVWVQGPAVIGSTLEPLGTVTDPVMLVVEGNLTVSANLQLFGVLYLRSNVWNTTAGSTRIHGAVIAEGNLSITGTPTINYDPNILRTINLTQGSLVRVPGSWRDFAAGS